MSTEIEVIPTVSKLRETVRRWRRRGETVGLVPTMGALHAGHMALVDEARRHADRIVASIFVNPTQFAAHEDLETYPRTFEQDCAMLGARAVDAVYAPSAAEMYPEGFGTTVDPGGPAKVGLEDAVRPHFFPGVATVVAKLFTQSGADVAAFGEKDYQQLLVIRSMARDLDIPVRVLAVPTVREADGLALSSRNRHLSAEDRRTAAVLPEVLGAVASRLRQDPGSAQDALADGRHRLAASGFAVDYLEVRDAQTLEPASDRRADRRLLVAARLGSTRLIDNVAI